jgi:hypothetical protein
MVGGLSFVGFSMRIFQEQLSAVTDTISSLRAQMRELELLRDQVRKAELSARLTTCKSGSLFRFGGLGEVAH